MVRMSEVHTIRFSELTKNLQFGAKTIMQNVSVPFIFYENKACSLSIRFFRITDLFDGRSFFNVFTRSVFRNQQKSDP